MPAITIHKHLFLSSLRNTYTEASLNDLLFTYGIELEETVVENGSEYLKLDIPANRYDLLCLEGMITAMQYYEANNRPNWPVVNASDHQVIVENSIERPVLSCAVVRNIQFDDEKFRSYINYQDSLNRNIGRNRRCMAMGTHDYDKIKFPVYYRRGEKKNLWITPLNGRGVSEAGNEGAAGGVEESDEHDCTAAPVYDQNGDIAERNAIFPKITIEALEKVIKKNWVLSRYITPSMTTSYFVDSNDVIISYPPVLNSDETKISRETKNVFIDMTGYDRAKIDDTMRYLIHNFGGERIEEVHIVYKCNDEEDQGEDGEKVAGRESVPSTLITPLMDKKTYVLTKEQVNKELRLNLTKEMIKHHLERMMHQVSLEEVDIKVVVHPARCDVMHSADLVEDIAVSYNINNFDRLNVPFFCIGKELIANVLSDKIRAECAFAEFNEVVSLCLLSREENNIVRRRGDCPSTCEGDEMVGQIGGGEGIDEESEEQHDAGETVSPLLKSRPVKAKIEVLDKDSNLLNINLSRLALERENGGNVELLNPKSKEYQVMRTSLIPGLLKFIKKNAYHKPPIRIFEVGEVFNINGESDTGVINCRRIAGAVAGTTDGLSDLIALINQVLTKCKVHTRLVKKEKSLFLEKRGGRILCDDDVIIGNFGVVHPRILKFYGIGLVCSIFEIDLDNLLKIMVSKR